MHFDVSHELAGLRLGDRRLDARARSIVTAIAVAPSLSFPKVFRRSEGDLEGYYRFTNNDAVEPSELLAPHSERSWRRAASSDLRLVVHDTTEACFTGEGGREGLVVTKRGSLLQLHVSLLVDEGAAPIVHGVVGMRAYLVADETWREVGTNDELRALECGSDRWRDATAAARAACPKGAPLVHVMDREADDFALWTEIVEGGDEFVIRSAQNRRTVEGPLAAALATAPYLFRRQVRLSRRTARRPPDENKRHPPREERAALLSVRAGTVEVKKPRNAWKTKFPPTLKLHVVEVTELEPPDGDEPVSWRLITTLPVTTPEEVARVVDIYRKRWLIEEFFKALKTGCALEQRQAESRHALLNTLALLIPVAVRLLALRSLGLAAPEAANDSLDEVELLALRHLVPAAKLPARPTNRQVMLAVARLGGHLRSNGNPGWQTLGAGYAHLEGFAAGWRAAISKQALRGAPA